MRNFFYLASLCFVLGCSYSDKEIRSNTSLQLSVPRTFRVEQTHLRTSGLDIVLEPTENISSYPKRFIKITERASLADSISPGDYILVGPDGEVPNTPAEPIGITKNLTGSLANYNKKCITYIGARVYLEPNSKQVNSSPCS